MAVYSLLAKDFREHWLPVLFLVLGCVAVFLLLIVQNSAAAYSMSSLEIVRYALLYLIPIVAFIVGSRLIVGEYLSGTRLFVESLPIGPNLPLVLKYLSGLFLLVCVSFILILLAANAASLADEITADYLQLIGIKTFVMVWLYWSIVFCFSLCGFLRIILYLLLVGIIIALVFLPGINLERIPPFALMDEQLFVFERDVIPWYDIVGTGVLAMIFTLAGVLLTKLGDGSVIERLTKPMTRRDYVAITVLIAAGVAIWTTVAENNPPEKLEFTSEYVVRYSNPDISILYLEPDYEVSARKYATRLSDLMSSLQASLAVESLPSIKLALVPDRKKHDVDYETADGVIVKANWLLHDSYDDAVLDAVLFHGVLSAKTNGRAVFEPYHWVLDGFTRWWVEQGASAADIDSEHHAELIARALWVIDIEPSSQDLIGHWQLTADRFAYPSAEALAWSAMRFIEQTQGREKVLELAREFLTTSHGGTVISSIKDRMTPPQRRVEVVLGQRLDDFTKDWIDWLNAQKEDADVKRYLRTIPAIKGEVVADYDSDGAQRLTASYTLRESELDLQFDILMLTGNCRFKHDYTAHFVKRSGRRTKL